MISIKNSIVLLLTLSLLITLPLISMAQKEVEMTEYMEARMLTLPENAPVLEEPFVVTSCGQSPGALLFKVNADQAGLEGEQIDRLQPEQLTDEEGKPKYGTVVVTTGTSLKGMGAAGIDVDDEVERCLSVIEKAKELGIKIVAAQIEGPARRTDKYDEKSITNVTPEADFLITRYDINWDGYFTETAKENEIPQVFIQQTIEVQEILPELFGKIESSDP